MKDTTWIGLAVLALGIGRELVNWHTELLRVHCVDFPWAGVALWAAVGLGFIVSRDQHEKGKP
ncbi:MAG: hypothetical protein ABFE07_28410 [Armatimonadia bacterium]